MTKNPALRGSESENKSEDEEELTLEEKSRKLRSPMFSFSNTIWHLVMIFW